MENLILIFVIFLRFILEVTAPIGAGGAVLFILVTYVAAQVAPGDPPAITTTVTTTVTTIVATTVTATVTTTIPSSTTVTTTVTTIPSSTAYESYMESPTNLSILPGLIIGSTIGSFICISLISFVFLLKKRYKNGKEKSKVIEHTNMSNNDDDNYNISNLGITNDELSKNSYENKSSSVPKEILISNPGQEHIPTEIENNSEIIQNLRKDMKKEMVQRMGHGSLNDNITEQNTSFGLDKEIIDQIRQEIIQDIKLELKQNLKKEITSSFTSEGISNNNNN